MCLRENTKSHAKHSPEEEINVQKTSLANQRSSKLSITNFYLLPSGPVQLYLLLVLSSSFPVLFFISFSPFNNLHLFRTVIMSTVYS